MNKKLKKILEKSDRMAEQGHEEKAQAYFKKEVMKIFDELTYTDIGEFMDSLENDVNDFSNEVKDFIKKEKKKKSKK